VRGPFSLPIKDGVLKRLGAYSVLLFFDVMPFMIDGPWSFVAFSMDMFSVNKNYPLSYNICTYGENAFL
jgi:hypothetical protein